jgi:DinB superfamily
VDPDNLSMDRPERAAALDYLRRKGTEAPCRRLLSGLRSTFEKFEQAVDRVHETIRTRRPTPAAWSVHEIVDHLVESHRPAVAELRQLCEGVSPTGGPIPPRLTSADALQRPWSVLIQQLKTVHASILEVAAGANDRTPLQARGRFVMVIKVAGESGPEVLEWVEALDWKAYAQALRVHTHEHLAQVERTVAALADIR